MQMKSSSTQHQTQGHESFWASIGTAGLYPEPCSILQPQIHRPHKKQVQKRCRLQDKASSLSSTFAFEAFSLDADSTAWCFPYGLETIRTRTEFKPTSGSVKQYSPMSAPEPVMLMPLSLDISG